MKPIIRSGLYAITDCANLSNEELFARTKIILSSGISMLQYRNKKSEKNSNQEFVYRLNKLCRQHNSLFIINDDIELAKEINADGAHIGEHDQTLDQARNILGNDAIIGVSCYNDIKLAQNAEMAGADYIAFGAFYPTKSKTNTTVASIELLSQARQKLTVPIVAIGGIKPDNADPLVRAGADLLAVISSIYDNPNPEISINQFNQIFRNTNE